MQDDSDYGFGLSKEFNNNKKVSKKSLSTNIGFSNCNKRKTNGRITTIIPIVVKYL